MPAPHVVLTPTHSGQHWYEVTANDCVTHSDGFHLSLPVFDPSLKRDDSHAVVLYRFDEGSGEVVHDRSTIEPAIDLSLPPTHTAATWLPGQGLTLNGAGSLNSMGPVDSQFRQQSTEKLMRLAKSRACTLEFWVSQDTLYASPDTKYHSCYVCWGNSAGQENVNFAASSFYAFFTVDTHAQPYTDWFGQTVDGARVSLHHIVFTRDDFTTSVYIDGELLGKMYLPWGEDAWKSKEAVLMLGNNILNAQPFIGSYYLVALHDRCLTNEQIRHNYNAGPSAR